MDLFLFFGFILGCEDESSTNDLRMYVVQLCWKILKQKSWPNIILQLVTWVCLLVSYKLLFAIFYNWTPFLSSVLPRLTC